MKRRKKIVLFLPKEYNRNAALLTQNKNKNCVNLALFTDRKGMANSVIYVDVVIWVQLHILRKIQCGIILNHKHNIYITEFAIPFLSVYKKLFLALILSLLMKLLKEILVQPWFA
jgi:hypothetical protein